jgi:two-component system LytT family response regulator
LENDPEIGEIQEAGSGEQTLAALRNFAPDLVFLDVQMPGMDCFTAIRRRA